MKSQELERKIQIMENEKKDPGKYCYYFNNKISPESRSGLIVFIHFTSTGNYSHIYVRNEIAIILTFLSKEYITVLSI